MTYSRLGSTGRSTFCVLEVDNGMNHARHKIELIIKDCRRLWTVMMQMRTPMSG